MQEGVPTAQTTQEAPPLLPLLLIFGTIFGGFAYLSRSSPWPGFLQALYRSVGLLTHDSNWAFGQQSRTTDLGLQFLAVLGPLLTLLAATYVFTDWLRPSLIRVITLIQVKVRHRECVALVGLNGASFALAASLRTTSGPNGEYLVPLIFSDEASGPLVERCRRYGIAIYARHRRSLFALFGQERSDEGLLRVRPLNGAMNRAKDLISFLPSVAAQVDFLAELQGWSPLGKGDCRAWILLEDRGLKQRLESQYARYSARGVTPRLLAISTLAARQLLLSQQFDTLADAFGQEQVHLAIYGMGDLGRAIVKEAAQLYVTRPALRGVKLRITFFDADADAAQSALLAEDPGLPGVVDLDGRTMRIQAAGLLEPQLECLAENATGHIITFDDGEAGFSLAVSLRRWLLEPPGTCNDAWLRTHHTAPIFVRAPSWHGLGRLFYKPVPDKPARQKPGFKATSHKRADLAPASHPQSAPDIRPAFSPLPDGIIGFGAIEGLFGAPELGVQRHGCLLDTLSELGAKAVHDAYCRRRSDVAVSPGPHVARAAETDWKMLSPQLRESNFRAFDHIAIKARAIGHRVVRQPDGAPLTPALEPGAVETLEKLEHLRYCAERMADGWRYADSRMDAVCVHPDLVDWAHLDTAEQTLDSAQIHALRDIANAANMRFANALVIGVVGHRPNRLPADIRPLDDALEAQLSRLVAENSERAPVLLTALAPGADTLAAEVAIRLGIPFMAPLPLPFELYREDFTQPGELGNFEQLAAAAELHIELPLRFGRASQMTKSRQPEATEMSETLRAEQYALAGAYIVQRAHVLIALSDGGGSHGTGGTDEVLAWWNGKPIPDEYTTPSHFFVRPQTRGAPIVIDIHGKIVEQPWQALHAGSAPGHNDGLSSHAV